MRMKSINTSKSNLSNSTTYTSLKARWGVKYKREPFKLFSIEEYTEFLAKFISLLRPHIVIQRIFGIADKELLIAPNWGYPKSKIQTYIDKGLEARSVRQGSLYKG